MRMSKLHRFLMAALLCNSALSRYSQSLENPHQKAPMVRIRILELLQVGDPVGSLPFLEKCPLGGASRHVLARKNRVPGDGGHSHTVLPFLATVGNGRVLPSPGSAAPPQRYRRQ